MPLTPALPPARALLALALAAALAACALPGTATPTPTREPDAPLPTRVVPATEAVPPTPEPMVEPATVEPAPADPAPTRAAGGPTVIRGEFSYTNDVITTYRSQYAVGMLDMHGFVIRDQEWPIPPEAIALGPMEVDERQQRGSFQLSLPARPAGTANDVDNDGQADAGVQIFALVQYANIYAEVFPQGDDEWRGWPSFMASTVNDPENNDEVTGGKLVVWAPDDEQQFPTDFGADGLLFTADDPVGPLPAGYSVVDLDQRPFALLRDDEVEATLYEPADTAVKDFSGDSYTEAFAKMFERVRREYAFNGIPEKEPDWTIVEREILPRIEQAERAGDDRAFFLAVDAFASLFRDGHVNARSSRYSRDLFVGRVTSGYGFAVRELDDGRALVVYVTPGGPAEQAGMRRGAVLRRFDGLPAGEAIGRVEPGEGPFSSDFQRRYFQAVYLSRAPEGTQVEVEFSNPRSGPQTATLRAAGEADSFLAVWPFNSDEEPLLPVEFEVLPSGAGYIRISDSYDDLYLIIALFERALQTFEAQGVEGLIIDLRRNSGGAPLGLAAFLHDEDILIGQDEYYSDVAGRFVADGPPDILEPFENQYRFDRMAVLVGQTCFSACEYEAYGFSKVPGMIVVGETPTGGVYAEVSRGQFRLPDDVSLQVPTGRTIGEDGAPIIEGTGVVPTLRVPATEENVLSDDDVVLRTAEEAVTNP